MKLHDLHWLAGLLEGEGCFRFRHSNYKAKRYAHPAIVLHMTDLDVVERAASLMEIKSIAARANPPHKNSFTITLHGRKAEALMRSLFPLMGKRRQAKITTILNHLRSGRDAKAARIQLAVKLRGDGMIFTEIAKTLGVRSHSTAMRICDQGM